MVIKDMGSIRILPEDVVSLLKMKIIQEQNHRQQLSLIVLDSEDKIKDLRYEIT